MSDLDRERGGGRFSLKAREGDFLFGLAWREKIKQPGKKPLVQIHFYWKRIFVFLCVLGIVAWFVGGAALYFYFKERRGYEEISYWKTLVLPFRLDQHRKDMGEFFIERGMEEIQSGEFRRGFHHLRNGLARSPTNAEARLLLARIFHSPGFGDSSLAIQALTEGLKYSKEDPSVFGSEYLGTLFYLLSEEELDERRIELADELMDQVDDPQVKALLNLQASHAEAEVGEFQAALERLTNTRLIASPQGYMLLANSLWRTGNLRRAVLTYERGMENFPQDRRLADGFFSLLEEEEMWEELLSAASYRQLIQPDYIKAWTSRLSALEGLGRSEEVIPAVSVIWNRFPMSETGFELLRFAVENKRKDVAELTMAGLKEQGIFEQPHMALMGLALLRGGDPQGTLDFLDEMAEEGTPMETTRAAGLRAMAHRMMGNEEAALTQFQQFLDGENLPPSAYATLSDFYAEEGFEDSAYRILLSGAERYPTSREILQRLILEHEKDFVTGRDFIEHAQALVQGRVPSADVLTELRAELVSDRYLFFPEQEELVTRIDDIIAQGNALRAGPAVTTSVGGSLNLSNPSLSREFMKIK
ncbi:tetratricopeptide repeat protein [Puniceicoccus vermicola]|uniref:Tetratricopeptide repeat protein n=1 Tax=Puniceicoccus vermicola TaxID=388746 RepID=A0A7X1AX29_9BACT|nr:hypothetical protein [Puniceicoccus vermicola]MBC2601484.1 hypothetical protein [Puniceicoccus vermicola]